jgi:hypothetical protein
MKTGLKKTIVLVSPIDLVQTAVEDQHAKVLFKSTISPNYRGTHRVFWFNGWLSCAAQQKSHTTINSTVW